MARTKSPQVNCRRQINSISGWGRVGHGDSASISATVTVGAPRVLHGYSMHTHTRQGHGGAVNGTHKVTNRRRQIHAI